MIRLDIVSVLAIIAVVVGSLIELGKAKKKNENFGDAISIAFALVLFAFLGIASKEERIYYFCIKTFWKNYALGSAGIFLFGMFFLGIAGASESDSNSVLTAIRFWIYITTVIALYTFYLFVF